MDVGEWLRSLGLSRYGEAFRDAEIGPDVLPDLTDSDLEKLGVPLGDRKRLLKAIASFGPAQMVAEPRDPSPTPSFNRRRRAPSANGDVLRSRRFDRAVGAAGSRGLARGHRGLSEMLSPRPCATSAVSWPNIWATACSCISAIRRLTRTTPNERCGPGSSSSRRSPSSKPPRASAASPRRHSHGARRGRRSDRLGRCAGARHRRRDAEPRGAPARHRRTEHGRHRRKHAKAPRQSLRA